MVEQYREALEQARGELAARCRDGLRQLQGLSYPGRLHLGNLPGKDYYFDNGFVYVATTRWSPEGPKITRRRIDPANIPFERFGLNGPGDDSFEQAAHDIETALKKSNFVHSSSA